MALSEYESDVMRRLALHGSYLLGLAETLQAMKGQQKSRHAEAIEGFIKAREDSRRCRFPSAHAEERENPDA